MLSFMTQLRASNCSPHYLELLFCEFLWIQRWLTTWIFFSVAKTVCILAMQWSLLVLKEGSVEAFSECSLHVVNFVFDACVRRDPNSSSSQFLRVIYLLPLLSFYPFSHSARLCHVFPAFSPYRRLVLKVPIMTVHRNLTLRIDDSSSS